MTKRRKTPLRKEIVDPAACSVDLRLSILKQVPFFSQLSPSDIKAVNEQFREHGFQGGEPIFFSGEQAGHLYIVAAGQVKLLRHSLSGQDVLLDILKPGDFFGSLNTTAEGVYPDTALAQTDVCVLSVSTSQFRIIMSKYPPVALAVLDITSRRLQETQETVRQLSVQAVEQRVAAVLIKLAGDLGEETPEGTLIQLPLSREELAQMTGTTTETASRVISQFQKEGLVNTGRRWLVILDLQRLEAVAGQMI